MSEVGSAIPAVHEQDVVCALLHRPSSSGAFEVLVTLRPLSTHTFPGLWEFPGGKTDAGETHAAALARECREELGVAVVVGAEAWRFEAAPRLNEHGQTMRYRLLFFWTTLADAEATPQPLASDEVRWLAPAALPGLPFCPGDEGLIAGLVAGTLCPQ